MKNYKLMVLVGLILWIGETAVFGFNQHAQSNLEAILDVISTVLIVWGILGDIFSGITIVKVDKRKTITNTEHLSYIDQRKDGKTKFNLDSNKKS